MSHTMTPSLPTRTLTNTSLSTLPSRNRNLGGSASSIHGIVVSTPSIHAHEKKALETIESPTEESLQVRIERLGRERPPTFTSLWSEIAFVFSISMSQFLTEYFVSGFPVLLPTLIGELYVISRSVSFPCPPPREAS